MSVLSRHPGRAVSLAFAAVLITAVSVNGPVAAGGTAQNPSEPPAVVSETVADRAPMIEPMQDVDEPETVADRAPMIEPMEDVDE